jgi:hypothetical protein
MPARSRGRGHGGASPSYYGGSGAGQTAETVVVASSYEEIGARVCVQSNATDSGVMFLRCHGHSRDAVVLTFEQAP